MKRAIIALVLVLGTGVGLSAQDADTSPANYLPEGAFAQCTVLTEISLPESLTGVGADAFTGCRALKEIHLLSKELTVLGRGAFPDQEGLTIFVPTPALKTLLEKEYAFTKTVVKVNEPDAVQGTPGGTKIRVESASDGKLTIISDAAAANGALFDLEGRLCGQFTVPACGKVSRWLVPGQIYIVKVGDFIRKVQTGK